jgi:hypothetical protein
MRDGTNPVNGQRSGEQPADRPSIIRTLLMAAFVGAVLGMLLPLALTGCGSSQSMLQRLNPPVGTTIIFQNDTSKLDLFSGQIPQRGAPCSFFLLFPSGLMIPLMQLPADWCSQFPSGYLIREWSAADSVRMETLFRAVEGGEE